MFANIHGLGTSFTPWCHLYGLGTSFTPWCHLTTLGKAWEHLVQQWLTQLTSGIRKFEVAACKQITLSSV